MLALAFLFLAGVCTASTKTLVQVVFTQAYRGLVEENDPIARNSSNNPDRFFIPLVDGASHSIRACFFDITDTNAVEALVRAQRRGVAVQIITDSDNLMEKEDPTRPRVVMERLRDAGIPIRDDRRGPLMHHKFMVVDEARVWLGSMNLTTSSIYHHNNNALTVHSLPLARVFREEFDQLFVEGLFSGHQRRTSHHRVKVGRARMRVFFSPLGGTRDAILEELAQAEHSIRFMAFSFTDMAMADLLVEKKKAGLEVEGIFDDCLIDSRSVYHALRAKGIRCWRDGNQALMHHKVFVIDGRTVITGSYNFSQSAEKNNNEDCVIISSRSLARRYLQEYGRLRTATRYRKTLPPYDHPACRHGSPGGSVPAPTSPASGPDPHGAF